MKWRNKRKLEKWAYKKALCMKIDVPAYIALCKKEYEDAYFGKSDLASVIMWEVYNPYITPWEQSEFTLFCAAIDINPTKTYKEEKQRIYKQLMSLQGG